MSTSAHPFNRYSQSERLIAIERYVKAVIERNGQFPRYWGGLQRCEYCDRVIRALPDLLSFYEPRHEYSEHIEAFWHASEKVGLLNCGQLTWMVDRLAHPGTDIVAIISELEALIASYSESPRFRRRAWDREEEQRQRREGLDVYTWELIGRYYRSLFLRTDLGYRKAARIDIQTVFRHLDALRELIHKRIGLFEDAVGFVWDVEQGESEGGYHIHFSLVLPGHLHQRDGYLTNQLGGLWLEITEGMGRYHSCNADKEKFIRRGTLGIGMIHRDDAIACENAVMAIGYLAKPEKNDQYLRMKPVGRRTFGKGVLKKGKGTANGGFRARQGAFDSGTPSSFPGIDMDVEPTWDNREDLF